MIPVDRFFKELVLSINTNDREYGFENPSDTLFKEGISNFGNDIIIKMVYDLFMANQQNVPLISELLYLTFHHCPFSFEGLTMATIALSHEHIEVIETGIRAFEGWGNKASIGILKEKIQEGLEPKWLQEYAEGVLKDIEK